jgi:hypothetical protein
MIIIYRVNLRITVIKHYSSIYLKELRKTMNILRQESQSTGSNPRSLEYEQEA